MADPWSAPRHPGKIICNICRAKIHSKWVAWSPTGAVTCNSSQCVGYAERVRGWMRYSEGVVPFQDKPLRTRRPRSKESLEMPVVREIRAAEQQREKFARMAADRSRVAVAAPTRSGWTCDGCGTRYTSRTAPSVTADGMRCASCL